ITTALQRTAPSSRTTASSARIPRWWPRCGSLAVPTSAPAPPSTRTRPRASSPWRVRARFPFRAGSRRRRRPSPMCGIVGAAALLPVTRRVVYLEDGDCAEIRPAGYRVVDARGQAVERGVHLSELTDEAVALGPYRHYMQKEIHEQPGALANTLEVVTGASSLQPGLFGAQAEALLRSASSIHIVACGTSYHAGLIGRYWLEDIGGIPTRAEIASEYRYRRSVPDKNGLFVTISQSGETAD